MAFMGLHLSFPLTLNLSPPPNAFRIIIFSFLPHTAAPGVTPADPMEIDFVVELPASAN